MFMEQQVHGLQQCGQRSPVKQHPPHISFDEQQGNNVSSNSPVTPIAVMANNWSGANCSLDSPCIENPMMVQSPVFFRSGSPNPQVPLPPLTNSSHYPLLQQQQQSAPLIEHQQNPMLQVISSRCPNSNSNCNNSGNNIMMSPYYHNQQQPQEQQQQHQHTIINNSNSGSNSTHQSCNSSVGGVFQQSSRYPPNTIIINPAGVTPMPSGRVTPVYNGGCSTPVGYATPGRVTPGRVTPGRIVSGRCTPVLNMPCKKRYVDYMLASTASTVAIDNKIEQAMDLVKSHLMFAVREEVDVLKEKIGELMERINHLEYENTVLKKYATQDTLQQLQHNAPNP